MEDTHHGIVIGLEVAMNIAANDTDDMNDTEDTPGNDNKKNSIICYIHLRCF